MTELARSPFSAAAPTSLDADAARARLHDWLPLYNSCFAQPPWDEQVRDLDGYVDKVAWHLARPGFTALEIHAEAGGLAGVAYGWPATDDIPDTDFYRLLVHGLSRAGAEALCRTGTFEIAELTVDPRFRGRGLARELLDALCGPHPRAWLATRSDVAAAAIYRHLGWQPIGTFSTRSRARLEVLVRETQRADAS